MSNPGPNPFEYGRELSLSELINRKDELALVETVIRNRGKLFIIGPRRFGKTSLLSAATEVARAAGVIVLRFDAEKFESLGLLAEALLTAATRALQGPLDATIKLLTRIAARLKPQTSFDAQGGISVSVGVSEEIHGALPLLTDTLDAIEQLAATSERKVVVILDEIQQIVIEHGIAAERQLRSTIQQHRHVGYIFAGSATRLLTEMTHEPNRPFYRLGQRIFLGTIPRPEFIPALEDGFRQGGFEPAAEACERIVDLAEDVPYNVQRLAHEAWEMLRASGAETLTEADVDVALDRLVSREDTLYTQVWLALRKNQKTALKAVIGEGGASLMSGAVARKHNISVASLQTALRQLEDDQHIRQERSLGTARYRLVDPFFAAWLRKSQSA
jgi:AAA+ ATPase superfamily predicted ATPase